MGSIIEKIKSFIDSISVKKLIFYFIVTIAIWVAFYFKALAGWLVWIVAIGFSASVVGIAIFKIVKYFKKSE